MSARWNAVVNYRSEHGDIDVSHDIEELDEIADIIESGPDWNTVMDIRITLLRQTAPGLTVEGKVNYD